MLPSLDLHFFHFFETKVTKLKLSFRGFEEDIEKDKMSFSIPDIAFKHGKDKATIHISLYDDEGNSEDYKFYVYYGKNSAYVETDCLSTNVYELILRNLKNVQIKSFEKDFSELDDLGNKCRQRLTLINYMMSNIQINGHAYNLSNIILQNMSENISPFNQISVLDLEKRLFIIQPIRDKSEYDITFLKDNKEFLLTFENQLNEFFDSTDYKKVGNDLFNTFKDIKTHKSLDLNRDKDYLNNIFDNNKFLDLDLFWNYSLCIFFLDSFSIEALHKNGKIIKEIIKKIKNIKTYLKRIKDLPLYEKARTIYSIFTIFFMKGNSLIDSDEIKNLNLRICLTDKKGKDSIMDRSYQMYNEFVNNLSEDSAIFPYLLNLDGGSGFYKNEIVYTFDLKNLDMIKTHLNQVYPKVIIFCYVKDGEEAITESEFGGIIINDYYITDIKKLNYNSAKLRKMTEEQKNDIAVNIFLKKIHEASGHKKYALSEEEYNSPIKIVNKNKDIITLKHENDYVEGDNKCEYILRSSINDKKGDSGHYLELCYGKYKKELIISILRKMKDKGNLINYPKLFTDDGKTLYNYVSLRKQIEENGIKFISKNKTPIEDEIKQMTTSLNNKIKNNKIEILKEENSKPNEPKEIKFLNQGKRKREEDKKADNKIEDNKVGEDKKGDNTQSKSKQYTPNYLKATNNNSKIEETKKEIILDEDKQESDRQYKSRIDRAGKVLKRVSKRFNIEINCLMKSKLKKILMELDRNDEDFLDIGFLISYLNIKY